MELRQELGKANRGAEAPVARRPALDAGRPALSARERLAETLPFDAIDAALVGDTARHRLAESHLAAFRSQRILTAK